MVCNTDIALALKGERGQYITKNFSVFEMNKIFGELPDFEVKVRRHRELLLSIKCPLCGEYHSYSLGINDCIKRDMIFCGCEAAGIPIFIIGKPLKVKNHIDKHNEISKGVYITMGAK